MPTEALVCPACRTWVEGAGRVVRCPACGTRFRASSARLDTRPASPSPSSSGNDRLFGLPDGDEADSEGIEKPNLRWPEAEEAPQPASTDSHEAGEYAPSEGETPAHLDPEGWRSRLNPSMLFTLAFLALIFFGNRLLSGELFVGALILLVAAQWLLRRHERGGA